MVKLSSRQGQPAVFQLNKGAQSRQSGQGEEIMAELQAPELFVLLHLHPEDQALPAVAGAVLPDGKIAGAGC